MQPAVQPQRRTVLVCVRDLFFGTRIERAVQALGHTVVFLKPGQEITPLVARVKPAVAVVDLSVPGFDSLIHTLRQDGIEVLAFGPHQQAHWHRAARAAGARQTVANAKLAADPVGLLSRYLE